jgi:hypothetical protein
MSAAFHVRSVSLDKCGRNLSRRKNKLIMPQIVHLQVVTETDEVQRAAEICLNYDKALRMAMLARKIVAKTG